MATLGTDDRKQPPENAAHVRIAIARFNWVKSVSDTDRDAAWKRIKAAGEKVRRQGQREGLARDWGGLGAHIRLRPNFGNSQNVCFRPVADGPVCRNVADTVVAGPSVGSKFKKAAELRAQVIDKGTREAMVVAH